MASTPVVIPDRQNVTSKVPMTFVAKCTVGETKVAATLYRMKAPATPAASDDRTNRNPILLMKYGIIATPSTIGGIAALVTNDNDV